MRFRVDPRDVPAEAAARRMGLTLAEFTAALPGLQRRGFPSPDPTTARYDLDAINAWMDRRHYLTAPSDAAPAHGTMRERVARM